MSAPEGEQPRRLGQDDLQALLGVVATLQGELMIGRLDRDLARRLYERLGHDLAVEVATSRDLAQELHDLAEQLHDVMGSYADVPPPELMPSREGDFRL